MSSLPPNRLPYPDPDKLNGDYSHLSEEQQKLIKEKTTKIKRLMNQIAIDQAKIDEALLDDSDTGDKPQ